MIDIVELENAVGNRLQHLVKGGSGAPWLPVFEGGMVCQLGVDRGWESGDEELEDDLSFDETEYSFDALLDAGVVSDGWIQEQKKAREAEMERRRRSKEQHDRDEYARLRLQFEKPEPEKGNGPVV